MSEKLTYHWEGDYLIPDLVAPESPQIGIWGERRRRFLRTHQKPIYDAMLMSGTLNAHMEEVDRSAEDMLKHLSAKQAAAVHSLARKHCCNCDNGICLLMEAPCAQIRSQKLVCRFFAEAVLPANANLNHEIYRNETEGLLQ